jgi:hypothetical protein
LMFLTLSYKIEYGYSIVASNLNNIDVIFSENCKN